MKIDELLNYFNENNMNPKQYGLGATLAFKQKEQITGYFFDSNKFIEKGVDCDYRPFEYVFESEEDFVKDYCFAIYYEFLKLAPESKEFQIFKELMARTDLELATSEISEKTNNISNSRLGSFCLLSTESDYREIPCCGVIYKHDNKEKPWVWIEQLDMMGDNPCSGFSTRKFQTFDELKNYVLRRLTRDDVRRRPL